MPHKHVTDDQVIAFRTDDCDRAVFIIHDPVIGDIRLRVQTAFLHVIAPAPDGSSSRSEKSPLRCFSFAGTVEGPARRPGAESFDIGRDRRAHIGFAHGAHVCLGMHLARREMHHFFKTLFETLPDLEIDLDATVPINGVFINGMRSLPCRYTPARAA